MAIPSEDIDAPQIILDDEPGASTTYHQLGIITAEQRDFAAAERRYHKSLEIAERLGNEHGAATTYNQLGILAALQSRFEEAARWLVRCVQSLERTKDPVELEMTKHNFLVLLRQASLPERQAMRSTT